MSSLEGSLAPTAPPIEVPAASPLWTKIDAVVAFIGDRLNPILVKEARQALKSKQFTITFALLLLAGWLWSVLGAMMSSTSIYYGAEGGRMFIGYFVVLALPLLVIVPFGAFSSLASERQDGTYELLSITTLKARQIVVGKLGSAVIQMLIYFSAITPCLAFTYLLRGIDLPSILFILAYTFLSSLGLSLIAVFCATLTRERHWHVVLSVILILGLVFVCIWLCILTGAALLEEHIFDFQSREFWVVCGCILSAYLSYFALIYLAAAAQLNFASDNRSTALRVAMLVQFGLFAGWVTWIWMYEANANAWFLCGMYTCAAIHWHALGALMTGESPELSLRVRRQLPQSFLGRVFLTWFSPGPGTGYIFVVSNLAAISLCVVIGLALSQTFMTIPAGGWWGNIPIDQFAGYVLLSFSYSTLYLGLGRFLIQLARKVSQVTLQLALLLQVLLVLAAITFPMIIDFVSRGFQGPADYTWLQIPSPAYTLYERIESSSPPVEIYIAQILVPAAALIVFLLNLPWVAEEVRRIRIAKPQRIAEDDAQIAAVLAPAQPVKTNPWD